MDPISRRFLQAATLAMPGAAMVGCHGDVGAKNAFNERVAAAPRFLGSMKSTSWMRQWNA